MKKILVLITLLICMAQVDVKASEPLRIIVRPIEKVNFTPVSFKNTENGLTLAGILFTPRDFNPEGNYPAVVVAGPMYSTKVLPQSI